MSEGVKLAENAYKDASSSYIRKQKNKIRYYILLNPRFSRQWFERLETSVFAEILRYRPALYIKPFRPYISVRFDFGQKINLIKSTYEFLKKNNLYDSFLKKDDGIELAKFSNYVLRLEYIYRCRKEGEIVISLSDNQTNDRLVFAAFSVENENNKNVCRVGCVQAIADKNKLKVLQKTLYGIRPKSFIIFALQEVCRQLQCSKIRAVSDKLHSYRRQHLIFLPWFHKINFDYDKFWTEIGGKLLNDWWFELPTEYKRKDFKEIKSQKRSMYRKRYALLDEVAVQIVENLGLQT